MWRESKAQRFAERVLPHAGAAYDLARWLAPTPTDAQDIVQDACLRAIQGLAGWRGVDARPWFLAIVRNCARRRAEIERRGGTVVAFDEALHSPQSSGGVSPERAALDRAALTQLRAALLDLPVSFREVLVLREMHDLDYREIAQVLEVPIGTVMSRLARARAALRATLAERRDSAAC